MRILVTGGAGFIGSNLVRRLVRNGHQVLCVDKLTYAGNRESLSDLESKDNFELLVSDICDSEKMQNAMDRFAPTWIAHLAAESHVDRSIDGPGAFVQTNIVGTFTLLHVARSYWKALPDNEKTSFRFLHVSTDEVYGSLGEVGKFSETTPYDPHSPYSASKAASDHLARAWHTTYGVPVLITNCSNNYGPYQFPEKLIPVVILKAIRGETIPVYGNGTNVRDWLYVEDHCSALESVLQHGEIGETYNIGGNNELKNIDLVRMLCQILDRKLPRSDGAPYENQIQFVTDRPGHDLRYAIDAGKIERKLGWKPEQDRRTGFERTVQWYLENREWCERILSGEYRMERLGTVTN